MLKSLFKPKWQSPDLQVRKQAITALDPTNDAEIIQKLALEDPSNDLRAQALAKITDTTSLQNLLDSASTVEDWCRFAVRINQLTPQTEWLVKAFSKAKASWDKPSVSKAISTCQDVPLAEALMVASDDPDAIFNIVTQAKSIDFRLKILQEINDYDLLQRLSKKATNKRVLQAVRLKLKSAKEQQSKIDETLENAESLMQSISKLSKQTWFDAQYEAKVNALLKHWQELDESLLRESSPLKLKEMKDYEKKFLIALAACQAIISGYRQEMEQAALVEDAHGKQSGLNVQLEKLIEEINDPSLSISSFHAIQNAWNILDENWLQTVDISQPGPNTYKKYHKLQQQLKDSINCWNKLIEKQPEIEQLFENKPEPKHESLDSWLQKWQRYYNDIGWPKDVVYPEVFDGWIVEANKVQAIYDGQLTSQKKKAIVLNQKLSLLEKHCQQRNLIAANKLEHYLEIRSKELSPTFHASFLKKRERIQEQLDELRDWHAFATTPKKQSLCETMESLIEESLQPLDKARKVRELQNQWRELNASDANADDELWERFKTASDTAYEPCLAYYAEKDKVKAENLKQKLKICESVEQLIIDSGWDRPDTKTTQESEKQYTSDYGKQESDIDENEIVDVKSSINTDWKKIEAFLQKTNLQWKKYQPIPENEYQSIQKHFNQILTTVNDKVKEEKQRNLDARCDLVEKAKKLLELDDINQSINGAIRLQKLWKEIGFTFFKADRKQWKIFRGVLDKIFEKRDSLNKSHKEELQKNLQTIAEISQKILRLCELNDHQLKSSYEEFETIKQSWQIETELPKAKQRQALLTFEKACQKYQEHFSGLKERQQKSALENLLLGAELLSDAEEKILNPDTDKIDLEKLKEKVTELFCDNKGVTLLNTRLEKLTSEQENQTGLKRLLELAIDTEILLGIDSPKRFKQQRMQTQLEQLQQGIGQAQANVNKRQEVLNFIHSWVAIGFIGKADRLELEARRAKIFDAVGL